MNSSFHDINKVYTLIRPPSPEDPFLDPVRHNNLIQQLMGKNNACYTLNSEGEIDIYLIMPPEVDFDEYCQVVEEFSLVSFKKGKLIVEISCLDEEQTFNLIFNVNNPLEHHTVQYLCTDKRVNIYYISRFDEEYMCYGMKSVYLPDILCYDLQRCLEGKTPLTLPKFSKEMISDEVVTEKMMTMKAWGFYLDLTSLQKRTRVVVDSDELISIHILHGIAQLQKARIRHYNKDIVILWIGRKITSLKGEEPREYYCVYLSGEMLSDNKGMGQGAKALEKVLRELPDYVGSVMVSPLEEEAMPLVMIRDKEVFSLNLTQDFYNRGSRLFARYFKVAKGYESNYQKIFNAQRANYYTGNVSDLAAKRWEKKTKNKRLTVKELKALIKSGREAELPQIFHELKLIKAGDVDDMFISICEHFRDKAEPYLLSFADSPKYHIRAAAILSLGIIESIRAIPVLAEKLTGKKSEAALAKDALAIIGEKAVDYLTPLLRNKKPEIRIRAIDTLSLIGSEKAMTAINNMVKDRSKRVEEAKKRVIHLFSRM